MINNKLQHPRHWLSWLSIYLLKLIARLPYATQIRLAKFFGHIMYRFASYRRHIVESNIRLCFPELSIQKQENLIKNIFFENILGIFETASSWQININDISDSFHIDGLELVEKNRNKGILLIGAHFVHMDLFGLMINEVLPLNIVYRRNNNPVFEKIITGGRKQVFRKIFDRSELRGIVKSLRDGHAVWYTPDQDFGKKHCIFAPFFGVNAATITSPSRLLAMGNAVPIGVSFSRNKETKKYHISFYSIDPNYPTGDDYKDALILNRNFEKIIRRNPEQYMWVHRRFKTRPDGEISLY